jgi:hypothetical protein
MMNGQPKHVRGPFYNIVQMAWPSPRRGESSAYSS